MRKFIYAMCCQTCKYRSGKIDSTIKCSIDSEYRSHLLCCSAYGLTVNKRILARTKVPDGTLSQVTFMKNWLDNNKLTT